MLRKDNASSVPEAAKTLLETHVIEIKKNASGSLAGTRLHIRGCKTVEILNTDATGGNLRTEIYRRLAGD